MHVRTPRRQTIGSGSLLMAAAAAALWVGTSAHATTLLNDTWADGSRAETNLPTESADWVNPASGTTVSAGTLSADIGTGNFKIWTFFTPDHASPATLGVGDTLTASLTFVPKVALTANTSRGFRWGLFYDSTSPRVEVDGAGDSGGSGDPWTDATGYQMQFLLTNDAATSTAPIRLGKRTNLTTTSLLGSDSAYTFASSGGTPASESLDTEYTATLALTKVSATQMDITGSLYQGATLLSTLTASDDGTALGTGAIYDQFDQLTMRLSNAASTAEQIDFTNFKVELTQVPEPGSLALLGLGGLTLLRRRRTTR